MEEGEKHKELRNILGGGKQNGWVDSTAECGKKIFAKIH